MGTKIIVLVQFYPHLYRSVYLGIKYIPTYTARYISVSNTKKASYLVSDNLLLMFS